MAGRGRGRGPAYDAGHCNGAGGSYVQPAQDPLWICASSPIPAGYVLTDHNPSSSPCLGDAWLMRLVTDGIWTCAGSPIPAGYVMTGHYRTGCRGIGSWFQQVAAPGLSICPGNAVPAGYHLGTYNSAGCAGLGSWVLLRN
ncbi:hypothetical protein GCM10010502_54160 [Kitasatospora aureofaciens]|uniref:Uncharacterized protein n=1 Tax=Kitasatospora aureofaciens TaxID=1894 RepID=A0A8H9LUF0_KITAU|nr:hypothetical protein GCM10010502_54160 [Kitasatospora aureofaciens]